MLNKFAIVESASSAFFSDDIDLSIAYAGNTHYIFIANSK